MNPFMLVMNQAIDKQGMNQRRAKRKEEWLYCEVRVHETGERIGQREKDQLLLFYLFEQCGLGYRSARQLAK